MSTLLLLSLHKPNRNGEAAYIVIGFCVILLWNKSLILVQMHPSYIVGAFMLFGLVNICIVVKITKFDNNIFLDFRAASESSAGSTVRLRTACP